MNSFEWCSHNVALVKDHGWRVIHDFHRGYLLERPRVNPKGRHQRMSMGLLTWREVAAMTEADAVAMLCRQIKRNGFALKHRRQNPVEIDFTKGIAYPHINKPMPTTSLNCLVGVQPLTKEPQE